MPGDLVRPHAGARELDHRADEVREVGRLLGRDALGERLEPPQLLRERDEGVHDLDARHLGRCVVHTATAARMIARTCIS